MDVLKRITLLGYEIIGLISSGCKESVDDIIEKSNNGIVEYLICKYKDSLHWLDEKTYNYSFWNEKIKNSITAETKIKTMETWHIKNEDDGLLLLLGIILDIVNE